MQIDTHFTSAKNALVNLSLFLVAYGFFTVRKFKLALCCFRHKRRTIISWRISFHLFSCTQHNTARRQTHWTDTHSPQVFFFFFYCVFVNVMKWNDTNERRNEDETEARYVYAKMATATTTSSDDCRRSKEKKNVNYSSVTNCVVSALHCYSCRCACTIRKRRQQHNDKKRSKPKRFQHIWALMWA